MGRILNRISSKNVYMTAVFFVCALLLSEAAIGQQTDKVVLIYSASSKALNLPSVSFYRSVATQFAASGRWDLVPSQEVDRYLPRSSNSLTPTSIPSIARTEFLKAHPQASGLKKKPATKGGLSRPLQEVLDTLAVQGAVVVDCVPSGPTRVRACGLYYYDRSAGRVVASMRKEFRVGITDATRWSDVMVAGLHSGLIATRDSKSKAQLETILDRAEAEDPAATIALSLDVKGESSFSHAGSPTVAPSIGLGAASMKQGVGVGIEGHISNQSSTSESGVHTQWNGKRFGLFMTSEVEAQESLLWSLDIGLGFSDRAFSLKQDSESQGSIHQREAYLTARPGLLWKVSRDSVRMGLVGDFSRFVGGKITHSGELEGRTLPVWSRGLSFRVKYVF